jgi:hypothetical protein
MNSKDTRYETAATIHAGFQQNYGNPPPALHKHLWPNLGKAAETC